MRIASFASRTVGGGAVLLALAAAGCDGFPFGSDRERVPATIEGDGLPLNVVVPTTATRGVPFNVVVTTYGGGCIEEDDTRVEVQGAFAIVRPYQIVLHRNSCTAELLISRRSVQVQLDRLGTGRVVFFGYSETANRVISVERTVTVQ
ncbi:MAG TPA: hypothetical protein VF746_01675 [Longimicrobium sp.]|jgi:hypothetical protein